jgi:hypothetical protein
VLADHLADVVAAAPPGAIEVSGLARDDQLDALRVLCPGLGWPATHAAACALATGLPVLTINVSRYNGAGLDVLAL